MKKQIFKKLGTMLIALFMLTVTLIPSKANAQVSPEVVVDIIEIIVDVFCPETPQNVCKQNTCQSGACVSFRTHCTSDDKCKN